MRSRKFDPTPPGCWLSFQGPSCHAIQNEPECFQDAIEIKTQKHSLWISRSEEKGAKVLLSSRNLFANLFRQFQKVANDKNKQRTRSFHGHGPSNPSGSLKSKGQKTNTRLRNLRSAPARSKNVVDELSRFLQSPNFPQNRPSKPPK